MNPDLDQLRQTRPVHLERYEYISLKSRPITVSILCDHAEMFWFGRKESPYISDVQLHSILVLGLNLGLRFEEVSKLGTEQVSTTSR